MNNLEVLSEIHKDSKMGMDSINTISGKIQDDSFKSLLKTQYNEYQNIFDRTTELLQDSGVEPKEPPVTTKAMSWMGIQMNTIADKSNSQISDLLIRGTNMGIIKGIQLLNNTDFANNESKNLLTDFIRLQEKNIDDLKQFL